MPLKLNSLKYFEKLIETKSYSKTAKYYGVTQPAVSMNIKRLKNEFNDQLIDINQYTGTINLTPLGKEFHKHAKIILQQFEIIESKLKDPDMPEINLGISPLIIDGYFPNLLSRLFNDENHKINLVENDTNTLLQDLKFGNLDLALVESTAPLNEDEITSEIIENDKINIIVSKNSSLSKKHSINFTDLKNKAFITMPENFLQAKLFKYFEVKYDTSIPIVCCVRDPKLINQLVKKDIGFSFSLNQWLPKNQCNGLVTLKLKENQLPGFVLSIAYSKTHKLTDGEKMIINVIKGLSAAKN